MSEEAVEKMAEETGGGRKVLVGVTMLMLITLVFVLLSPYLQLDYLESQRSAFMAYYGEHPLLVASAYIAVTVICIGLALPATGVFALLAGALFGFGIGVLLCTIAGTLGSTIAFLWSRHLFRDWVQRRFSQQLVQINRGIDAEGGYYLFSIRLLMIFPFFLVNLLSGVTSIRLVVYIVATFFSQTIVVAVWVYAGATLASLNSSSDILTLRTFASLALIGLAPLIIHKVMLRVRA